MFNGCNSEEFVLDKIEGQHYFSINKLQVAQYSCWALDEMCNSLLFPIQ
jgi:hypothetical protein